MQNIHPLIVHFPIALFFTAFLFDMLGWLLKKAELNKAAKWNLWVGTVGAAAAVGTGLWAESMVEHSGEVHQIIENHETLGFVVLGISILLSVWRGFKDVTFSQRSLFIFLSLVIIMLATISVGAYLGGRMVYEYGVGGKIITAGGKEQEHGSHLHDHH
jgi:uncharacterized membrane protein